MMTTSKGTPLQEIYAGETPWDYQTLPVLVSQYHSILYQLNPNLISPPKAFVSPANIAQHHWEEGYVRMPYSPRNVFPSKDDNDEEALVSRWELIEKTLLQDILSSRALEAAMSAYNSRLPKFHALHHLFEDIFDEFESRHFFTHLLPGIIRLALKLPEILPGSIPLLKENHCKSISLSQEQIACLLANAFLATFPGRKSMLFTYPNINFTGLFSSSAKHDCIAEKIKCIIHYFKRILEKMPVGVVTFERQHLNRPSLPRWDKLENNLGNVRLHVDSSGTIEDDGLGLLQVDFANKFLGGGVLNSGCVQEEIRFVICPELIISRLFTERLGNNEALIITGIERFSKYKGYGETFAWDGNFIDDTPHDDYGRRRCTLVAIDATHFGQSKMQFKSGAVLRELMKAYCGFHSRATGALPAVATGNWGCGAFGGNVHLKFFIQLMACSAARRDLVYFTFGSTALRDEIYNMHTFLASNQITVMELWRLLCQFAAAELPAERLFSFVQQAYFDSKKQTTLTSVFSQLHSLVQQRPPITLKPKPTSSSTKNTNMDWKEGEEEKEESISKEETGEVEESPEPEPGKRKRKTSGSASILLAAINQIDGIAEEKSPAAEDAANTSWGFLSCVDEYTKKKLEDSDKKEVIEKKKQPEEMDVEEILESLAAEKTVAPTPKRKITDYFKIT